MDNKPLNIYSAPELYDAVHWWKTNDIEFICELVSSFGDPVLELAAGTGRLAVPLAENGFSYTGLDNSAEYVKWASDKLSSFENASILLGDMRSFNLKNKYQSCFIGFNSIFHLMSNNDILSCFQTVYGHLNNNGLFFIDMFLPDPSFLHRDPTPVEIMEFDHPDGGKCTVKETNSYDDSTQINSIIWYFYTAGKKSPDLFTFDMHMIYPDTMFSLLNEAGFSIKQVWGDYDKSPLTEESRLQFYVCQK